MLSHAVRRSLVGDMRSVRGGAMKRLGLVAGQRRQRRAGRERAAVRRARRSCSAGFADTEALLGDGGTRRRFRGNADAVTAEAFVARAHPDKSVGACFAVNPSAMSAALDNTDANVLDPCIGSV
jgi:hypothetical protein